jgi:hypothetical protein
MLAQVAALLFLAQHHGLPCPLLCDEVVSMAFFLIHLGDASAAS